MRRIVFFLLVAALTGIYTSALAERIVLRSGKSVEGEMIQMNADTITLEVFGVPTTYNLADVESIDGEPFVMPPKLIAPSAAQEPSVIQEVITSQPQETLVQQEPLPQPAPPRETLAERQKEPRKIAPPEALKPFAVPQRNIDDARAYFEIGYIHQSLGDDELAKENYEKALAIDPDLGQIFFNDALNEYYLNNEREARDKLMRAKALFEVQEDLRMMQLVNEQLREFFQPGIPEDEEIELTP